MCMQPLAKSFLIYASPPPTTPSLVSGLSNVVALERFKCGEDVIRIIILYRFVVGSFCSAHLCSADTVIIDTSDL